MKRVVFCIIIAIIFVHFGCESRSEVKMKRELAKFEDKELPLSEILLKKEGNYYQGYYLNENNKYFLLYPGINKTSLVITRIFSEDWRKSKAINESIIKALNLLSKYDLEIETIYDNKDSVFVVLIKKDERYDHSNCIIYDINQITSLHKYKIIKCMYPHCYAGTPFDTTIMLNQ